MPGKMRKLAKKAGLPPGSIVYTGDKIDAEARITIIEFDESRLEERQATHLEECLLLTDKPTVTWINVNGLSKIANLEKLGECFNLHPLVVEDIANIEQRPKIEDYEDYLFIVLKAIAYDEATRDIGADQVSLVLGANYLISFHESGSQLFAPIREHLMAGKGHLRKAGADYLAYALMDLIVDQYFVVLERFGENLEYLEEEVVKRPTPETLLDVHRFKNDMILLRKSMWPLREVIGRLERKEFPFIKDETIIYCKDVYDHTIIAIDTVETYRDILSGMLDIYLSSVSNRLNEVMKILTIIATIFMPLTFLTGLYGMNFEFMPGLKWSPGFFAMLGLMTAVTILMLAYFKRKRWF